MSCRRRCILGAVVGLVLWVAAPAPARAQACLSSNCVFGALPAACRNRAAPRTPTVLMTTIAAAFVFDPQNPKIEPGECITWRAATATHSSSDNHCADDPNCGMAALPTCQWDSANVSSVSATPTSTCYYDPALFPPAVLETFYCRIHATPTVGTMRGTLRVTTPIVLSVNKDLATNSVKLSWTGGGLTGDFTYKVARNTGGDPSMQSGTTTVNPDGGVTGTTFTDAGDLLSPDTHYYLVRNKQTNEP